MVASSLLHHFQHDVSGIEPPTRFTYPFHYVPHELCVIAAHEVMDCALGQPQWHDQLMAGKMLGVLVVEDDENGLGYLAAYSGNLAHGNDGQYFVPHVYNLLEPNGLFRTGEARISEINRRIKTLESSPDFEDLKSQHDERARFFEFEEHEMRLAMEKERAKRHELRLSGELNAEQERELTRQSQYQKAEFKRMRQRHAQELNKLKKHIVDYQKTVDNLKHQRKVMSEQLQGQLFDLFVLRNAQGESCSVKDIFYKSLHRLPPGGTGDCCAPKLLNHAFNHGLHPLCMAEFWVGKSPLGEVRHHGHFYPACRGKCLPLLQFMLQGLDVERNTLELPPQNDDVNVVYEDEWILIADKPAGMLTVPGKAHKATSVLDIVKRQLPGATGPLIVHRLDQSTSGLVMVAKTKEVHKSLQSQFADRRIGKIYIALLNAVPACDHGVIDLPLCPNPYDRPRQMVSIEHGKRAVTEFKVLEKRGNRALVEFKPLTGRTHQLRVHASHPQGLNCPIVGDMLYGTASDRLYLHALSLSFTHPITGKHITVTSTLHPF